MKNSKIVTLSLLAAGLMLALAPARAAELAESAAKPAQGEHPRRDMAAAQLKMLAEKLNLTDAQKAQATEILKAEAAKVAALREGDETNRREKMKEMRAIREESRAKIRAILTAEQQKIFDNLPKRRPGGPGGPRGEGDGGQP